MLARKKRKIGVWGWSVVCADQVRMFVSIPPKLSISDFMRRDKGRSSFLIQREFSAPKKRYGGNEFGAGGTFRP
ncbi:transposase [Hoeflea sp.]|uniref:transposase n=1 Tax=Hoeflea sp. TaxID=1940281 RepID=UPI003A90D05C